MIQVYTDSMAVILAYNNMSSQSNWTFRKKMKMKNYLIWEAIRQVVQQNNLNVKLVKVKAHNNDKNNEAADQLAKPGCLASLLEINYSNIDSVAYRVTWNSVII